MNDNKKIFIKRTIIILSISFVMCFFLTVTYAILSNNVDVEGSVDLKSPDNIRTTNIVLSGSTNGGAETYNPNFYIDSVSTSVSLPSLSATVTYTVTIRNKTTDNYIITDIGTDAFTNSDMEYVITDLAVGTIIYNQSDNNDFTITYRYKAGVTELPADIDLSAIIKLTWQKVYFLTYDSQGGSTCDPAIKNAIDTKTYGTLCAPTKTDYTFAGWYTETNGTGTHIIDTDTVGVTTDTTIYAKWIYTQELLVGNTPTLTSGMIPVVYDETNKIWKKANLQSAWYDYTADTSMWANFATVSSTNRSTLLAADAGTTIPMSDINTMYVWIPRYSYAIKGTWGDGGTSATSPGLITIKFVNTSTDETGDASYTTTVTSSDWLTHPAFWWDADNDSTKDSGEQSKGFWFSKFEASPNTACTAGTTVGAGCDVTTIMPISKPDVLAWRGIRASTAWTLVNSYMNGANGNTNYGLPNDTTEYTAYVMTNSEWGAVAYLSQSIYGKDGESNYTSSNKEIYINNSSGYYTGRSGGRPGYASGYTVTDGCFGYDGLIKTNNTACNSSGNFSGTVGQYLTGTNLYLAYGATTTGNIYGAYDMSGSSLETTMSDYYGTTSPYNYTGRNSKNNTGFNGIYGQNNNVYSTGVDWPSFKYYNRYYGSTLATQCNGGICYGHALSEVYSSTGWWSDSNGSPLTTSYVIFLRSGAYNGGVATGVFHATISYGTQATNIGFRTVIRTLK